MNSFTWSKAEDNGAADARYQQKDQPRQKGARQDPGQDARPDQPDRFGRRPVLILAMLAFGINAGVGRRERRVVRAVGSSFAGVDVVTVDPTRPLRDSGGVFLEINTTPGIHHHYLSEDDRRLWEWVAPSDPHPIASARFTSPHPAKVISPARLPPNAQPLSLTLAAKGARDVDIHHGVAQPRTQPAPLG